MTSETSSSSSSSSSDSSFVETKMKQSSTLLVLLTEQKDVSAAQRFQTLNRILLADEKDGGLTDQQREEIGCWLGQCYMWGLQATTINLDAAFDILSRTMEKTGSPTAASLLSECVVEVHGPAPRF